MRLSLCLRAAGSCGKVSARGESLPEVPGSFPHAGKVRRKFREGFRTRGKFAGSSGKVSARGESSPEVPGRFPHAGKVCRKCREGFLIAGKSVSHCIFCITV
ncbi:MAG: hypothetical protein LBM08_09410 [Dysgonamonadaceae bacterium]|nr:hypothetical protein [Dysgonamonadaceae bacterium]